MGELSPLPYRQTFWEHLEINHSCDHMFIIANPADTFLSTFQKNINTDLFSLCAWIQVVINLLGIKLASVVMNTDHVKSVWIIVLYRKGTRFRKKINAFMVHCFFYLNLQNGHHEFFALLAKVYNKYKNEAFKVIV